MRGCSVARSCRLFATPWTVVCQAPLSMELFRQEYQSGLPFPPPGHPPYPGTKPESAAAPALAGGFFATEPPGKSHDVMCEGPAQSGETQPCAPLCPSPESRAGQLSFQLWPLTNAKTDTSGGKPCRSRASLTAARVPEPLEQSLPPHPEHLTLITRNWPTFLQKKAVTLVRHLKTTSRGISPSSLILGALDGCR